jgi:phosphoglycerate dehydrogenase-like enzyme
MTDTSAIRVIVAMDFSDALMEQLRAISPRLQIERHFPKVPDSAWANAEVLYTGSNLPEPAQAPRLRWIQLQSAGMEHVLNRAIVRAEDVEVTSTSGIHATPIAEYCLAMMLAFAYRLPEMLKFQAHAEWPEDRARIFAPRSLRGQTVGIVGYGSIGRELARIAAALGMVVVATKRDLKHPADEGEYRETGLGDPDSDIPARLYPPEAVASMATVCDYLVVAVPLTDATHHMVNEEVLSRMKKNAVLVNIARGAIVDEAALISALAAGTIAGAALDVFEEEPLPATSPLWQMDNVIISPHISGNMARYHDKAAALFAENLQRYLEHQPLLNRLDRKRGY